MAVATGYTQSFEATGNYVMTVGTPTFSLATGTYGGTQTVTISDVTPGAALFYTTNGSTPTTASTPVTGPITVSSSQKVQAMGTLLNYTNSAVGAATYTITAGITATPAFSVAAGTYASAQTVTLSDSTSGAKIYYTTNGTTPTSSSTLYTGALTVGSTETVEAIAVASGLSNSAVATAAYTIASPVATPVFSIATGTYTRAQTVTLSDATSGATIYYTINGTAPTTSSTPYSGAITVGATETVEAIAVASGYSNSAVATVTYTITYPVATPTFSVAAGTYTSAQTVALSDATSGAKIYYTTNGTTPTAFSTLYSGPITVGATETVEAIAAATGYSNSSVATAAFTITLPATAPVFSLASGTYTGTQSITISDVIPLSTIYYTTNGTTPTTASTVYSGPVTVNSTETVEAIAIAVGFISSPVTTANYTIVSNNAINYPTGFKANELDLDGFGAIVGTALQLTNGGTAEESAGWYPNKVTVNSFTTDFDFQLPTSVADGFTFTIQNGPHGLSSLGGNGSGLGYYDITNSVAVAFNLYDSSVANAQYVGVYTGGVFPQGNSVSLVGSAVNLHSGDPFHVHIVYNGTTMTVTLTDNTTAATITENFTVNVVASVGSSSAWVGFTGATGGLTSTQNILDWTFSN
jgi:hypothetical protein